MHITPPFHAQVIHMTCITIPFVRYVRFVPLNLSDPPAILTSIKKVKKVLTKKGIQMNSLHENRNSLESYSQIRERLADSICPECEYACFVHKENCSRKVVK
jgi:effector-binding domain-containing protein